MAQKRVVDYQGRQVEGEVVEFQPVPENWTTYTLEDGSTMKMKLSLLEVVRLLGEFNPQTGEPIYIFTAQNIVNTNSPDHLKKKK